MFLPFFFTAGFYSKFYEILLVCIFKAKYCHGGETVDVYCLLYSVCYVCLTGLCSRLNLDTCLKYYGMSFTLFKQVRNTLTVHK